MRSFFFAKFGAKVVLEMARDSFYSEESVSPYKRDGKQVGWKGTLHYHDMGELDLFGKPKRKTTSKAALTKGKRVATAELKQWRDDMEKDVESPETHDLVRADWDPPPI